MDTNADTANTHTTPNDTARRDDALNVAQSKTQTPAAPVAPSPPRSTPPIAPPPLPDTAVKARRSRLAALLLTLMFGMFGVHQYYLGNVQQARLRLVLGIVGILTSAIFVGFVILFGLMVWIVVDLFRLAFGSMADAWDQPLLDDVVDRAWSRTIGILLLVLMGINVLLFLAGLGMGLYGAYEMIGGWSM